MQAAIVIVTGWATTILIGAGLVIEAVAGRATSDSLAMGFISIVLDNDKVVEVMVQAVYYGDSLVKPFMFRLD